MQLTYSPPWRLGSPGLFVAEDAVVDVRHEVPSRGVGHDEAHVVCRLEAAVQVDQEGVPRAVDSLEDSLLALQAARGGGRQSHESQRVQGSVNKD